jgi:hypothetical protein
MLVDGWSFWDGHDATPYGIDTVADVDIDTAGGSNGAYYVHRVTLRRDPERGDEASIAMLRRGIWKL